MIIKYMPEYVKRKGKKVKRWDVFSKGGGFKGKFKRKPKQWIRKQDIDTAVYYPNRKKPMTQDEIQEGLINKGIKFFEKEKRGFYNVAMRAGKCRITIELLKKLAKEKFILIAYPDNKLEQTWKDEFELWDYTCNVTIPPFYVNFSSLKKYKDVKFDIVVIDEFHAASPNERDLCHQIMTNNKECLTIALSGTVSKETKEEWGLKEIASYSTKEGIEAGILADYKITVHLVDLDTKIKTPNKKGKLLSEKQKYEALSWVINKKQQRGEPFMMLALVRNRLSLSSVGKMEYVRSLLRKLKGRTIIFTGLTKVADEIGIPSYHNKSTSNGNFLAFQAGEIDQLALAAMGKVGVSFTNLDSVIMMNFTHNMEDSAQTLNRCIKLDYSGKVADMHIIVLNEPAELKKIKNSLKMLDQSKVKYV